MKCHAVFVFAEEYLNYRFHADHPFDQKRVMMTKDLLEASNTLNNGQIIAPRSATEDELALVHDKSYIQAVKKAGKGALSVDEETEYGIGTEDTPVFDHMHEVSAVLVGGTLRAVDTVLQNKAQHALNLGGGLHHGFRNKASGFCIYNDAAIAIQYIRESYNLKVLYVDTDAHHGDGVQWAFYGDPNVCTLSIHETGRYLFPGTGNINERGIQSGYGYSFNFPIDAFTEDESFLQVYESAFREITEYFRPDVIITQNGADAHCYDPLTHLCTTMRTFERIPTLAHELAHKYCHGKWIALGGGGYDIGRVVPRAWAQIWNVMSTGQLLSGPLPQKWSDKWTSDVAVSLPTTWGDTGDIYPPIPRKAEITEKNEQTLAKTLQFSRNHQTFKGM